MSSVHWHQLDVFQESSAPQAKGKSFAWEWWLQDASSKLPDKCSSLCLTAWCSMNSEARKLSNEEGPMQSIVPAQLTHPEALTLWKLRSHAISIELRLKFLWNRNPWTNLRNRKALLDTSHSWLFWIHQISPGHSGHESPCYLDICEILSDQAITSEAQIHRGFRKVSQLRHFVAKASKVQQLQPLRIWSVLIYTCNEQN